MKRGRVKRTYLNETDYHRPLPGGKVQLVYRDSINKRQRKEFDTAEKAIDRHKQTAIAISRGEHVGSNTTFNIGLDLDLKRKERTDNVDNLKQNQNKHLRPTWGPQKVDWFIKTKLKPMQDWLDELRRDDGERMSPQTKGHLKTAINGAFRELVREGLMPFNPVERFGLNTRTKWDKPKKKKRPLTLAEISAVICTVHVRAHGERVLTWSCRVLMNHNGLWLRLRSKTGGQSARRSNTG
jgi:hypothetical protein